MRAIEAAILGASIGLCILLACANARLDSQIAALRRALGEIPEVVQAPMDCPCGARCSCCVCKREK